MKICEYGCGQEAKYLLKFKNVRDKWCCSKSWRQCFEVRRKMSESHKNPSEETRERMSESLKNPSEETRKRMSESHKNKKHSKETRKKISKSSKNLSKEIKRKRGRSIKSTIEKIQQKYKLFSEIEEMRYNPDKPGDKEIQVHCKNHHCPNSKEKGGWFTPTSNQIYHRANTIKNPRGFGESNFYCSQKCKDICPSYNLYGDPFKNTELPYTYQEQQIWKQKVLKRQKEDDGYNFCEKCYSIENLHVHHEKPVKTHPHLALDPDNGIVLCEDCHYKYGHKAGTECSTSSLANKILPGCTLGGQK